MSITITTWNVQNLAQSDPVFADKLNFLVGTLQALGSDVVALQEILDLNALQSLATGLGFHHFAAEPDHRGNRVAFLTRHPPALPTQQIDQWRLPPGVQVRDFGSSGTVQVVAHFPRPAFQISVAHGGGQIDIVTAHLKSKLLTFGGNFSTTNETLRAQTAYFARFARKLGFLASSGSDYHGPGESYADLGDMPPLPLGLTPVWQDW